jgi:hypothetical protein
LNPAQGGGVQPVINAIAAGDFNDPNVTFQDVQKAVIGALTAKGDVKVNDIGCALASLYGELSKHHHTGVSEALSLREGEQTLTEAIGALSIILFARWLYASNFDAVYFDSMGNVKATLSSLWYILLPPMLCAPLISFSTQTLQCRIVFLCVLPRPPTPFQLLEPAPSPPHNSLPA